MAPGDRFYSSTPWLRLRSQALARDHGRCTVAHLLGGTCSPTLSVHHILSRKERPDLAYDLDNLATVCTRHHPVWESVRRFLIRQRNRQIDAQLDREARLNRATEQAKDVALAWNGDTPGLHDEFDLIERAHRVRLPWHVRDDLIDLRWQRDESAAA